MEQAKRIMQPFVLRRLKADVSCFRFWIRRLGKTITVIVKEDGKRLLQHCSGGRGATDILFHNKRDLFRAFRGKVAYFGMWQQVLS